MNETELERSLTGWLGEDAPATPAWVLEGVVEHAHRRSNQGLRIRLRRALSSVLEQHPSPGGAEPANHHVVRLAAIVASTLALLLVLPMVTLVHEPRPGQDDAALPGVGVSSPSPSCSPAPLALPSPESEEPEGDGLTGSVWLAQADGAPDHYLALHPDGTLVERVGTLTTMGIGVWQPTGEHSLTSVIIFTDGDPLKHGAPGQSTYRADWALDPANATGTLTWRATVQGADGSALPEASGEERVTRLHPSAMPAAARFALPDERPWRLVLGPMTPASGEVDAVGDVASLSECSVPADDPPGYILWHGDGTSLIASTVGVGVGLWAPSGPATSALTAWSYLNAAREYGTWLGERRGRLVLTGTEDGFRGSFVAASRRLKAMDGRETPSLDAAHWPSTGSVWLQPTEGDEAVVAYLTDGTVVARHPTYGTGVGYWQPTGPDTLAASVFFATRSLHDDHLLWEATLKPDGQHLSVDYQLVDANSGAISANVTEAMQLRLAP